MAARKQKVWAKRPFTYNGVKLARGQVFELIGARNDDKLLGMNYVGEIDGRKTLYEFEDSGIEFIGEAERQAYGDALARREQLKAYGKLDPEMEDRLTEEEIKLADAQNPLIVASA